MAARLMEVEGEVQRSQEGVMHLMARRVFDRSAICWATSSPMTGRAAPMSPAMAPHRPRPRHGHPSNVRILPKSRDFH